MTETASYRLIGQINRQNIGEGEDPAWKRLDLAVRWHPEVVSSDPPHRQRLTGHETIRLLNVDFDDLTMDDLLEHRRGTFITVHTDMMRKCQENRDFYDKIDQFDLVTCDSQILVFAAKLLGTPFKERVSGSDYFPRFCEKYRDDPTVKIFICGAVDGVSKIAQRKINERAGRELVVDTDEPPFGWLDDPAEIQRVLDKVNASDATVFMIGLSAPNGEVFIQNHKDRMPDIELFMPLGGTIDYQAGAVKRPAPWVTNVGLEWVWRVMIDPKNRWKRYFVEQPPVLWWLVKQKFGRYNDPWA